MRAVFADLKTDFVFKKVFGAAEHKDVLIALLNALLGLAGERAIAEVTFLREEERPRVDELKFSVVDVKCRDGRGTVFVVEMQVLTVAGFEKRVVYNASKAYVGQLAGGDDYPRLNDVIAVSICDFVLWPDEAGAPVGVDRQAPEQQSLADPIREAVMGVRKGDEIPMPKWFNDLEREIEARGEAAALFAVLSARGLRLDVFSADG